VVEPFAYLAIKRSIIMEQTFSINDFVKIRSEYMAGLDKYKEDWECYNLYKECIVMHKLLDIENWFDAPVTQLTIMVYKDFELSNNISRLNEYITWLGCKCEKMFIQYFHDNYTKILDANKSCGSDWYDTFSLISLTIEINRDNKICAIIEGFDRCTGSYYHNEILLEENTIISIEREKR
jgi:hypothetical protein